MITAANVPNMTDLFYHRWMISTVRYTVLAPNVYTAYGSEMDLFGLRKSGYCDEIEIKTTLSDFKADFKKTGKHGMNKHASLANGTEMANYFSFLVPEDLYHKLCAKMLIPAHAGVYSVNEHGTITERIRAPKLHPRKISDRLIQSMTKKVMYRYWSERWGRHRSARAEQQQQLRLVVNQ